MAAHAPLILACSPRSGGNTDAAAEVLARNASEAGPPCELFHLRDFDVLPCQGCGHCAAIPDNNCILARKDQAEELFARLLAAPWVAVAAPIFFYHLPAGFKALIDRAQRFHHLRERLGVPETLRPAHAVLVAGRPRGDKLFEGSLLTLKYFFKPLGLALAETVLLRGVDGPMDLLGQSGAVHQVAQLGSRAAKEAASRPA